MYDILNVLYSSSDYYAPMAGISILSLLKNNVSYRKITIHLISNNISDSNLKKIRSTVVQFGQEIVVIDSSKLEVILAERNVPKFNGSYATCQKIFVNSVVPHLDGKLLFIDSDTIVSDDLGDISNINQGGAPYSIVRVPMYKEYCTSIGIASNECDYPNCGVILFDLNQWRERKCEERIVDFLQHNQHKDYRAADQDFMSAALLEPKDILPPRFNVGASWAFLGINVFMRIHDATELNFYSVSDLEYSLNNPIILHCMGGFYGRPWETGNFHPFNDIWQTYKKESLWKDLYIADKKFSFVDRIQKAIWYYCPKSIYIFLHKSMMKLACKKYKNSCKI